MICFAAALPQIPGAKKKRGRPSKADLAAREAFKAAQEAKEATQTEAAAAATAAAAAKPSGKPHGKPAAVPIPTADLDPPALQSASISPAAANAAAAKPAVKKPAVATSGAESAGKGPSAKGRSLSPKGISAAGKLQKSSTAVPATTAAPGSPAPVQQDVQQPTKDPMLDEDADDDDDYMPLGAVAAAAPKPGLAKGLKRLKKQPPASASNQKQTSQNALEDEEAAPGPSPAKHAKRSQGSGHSQEQPFSPGEASHVEIFVDAVGLPADLAGCARARPWTKHKQKAAAEAQAAAQAAQELAAEQQAAYTAQLKSAPAAPPAAATATVKCPTAVAVNQDSGAQVGSGGRSQAAAAELSGQKDIFSKKRLRKDIPAGNEAQQAQQQDQHSQVQTQHAPRGSRTSPRSPLPLPVDTQRDDSRTGTSQPRTGHSQPRSIPAAEHSNTAGARRTQHRQTEQVLQQAPASPSNEGRSGDSSDNATVQHGVGHTGESSEALPASMKSSKPALQLQQQHRQQRQQQQQHDRPTSSLSEQAIHSAAGNTKSQLPGVVLISFMLSCPPSHAVLSQCRIYVLVLLCALVLCKSARRVVTVCLSVCLYSYSSMYKYDPVFVHAAVTRQTAIGNMPCATTKTYAATSRVASTHTLSSLKFLEVSIMWMPAWHASFTALPALSAHILKLTLSYD